MEDDMTYDDAYNALYDDSSAGGGDSSSQFWTSFLNAGASVGSALATKALFGSKPATAQDLQAQRQAWNQQNGSGVVNWQSALRAPLDEITYLYGNPAARAAQPAATTPAAASGMSGGMIAVIVGVVILLFVLILRR